MWLTGSVEPPVETLTTENPHETAFVRYFKALGDVACCAGASGGRR
jgi:hypothetical protein